MIAQAPRAVDPREWIPGGMVPDPTLGERFTSLPYPWHAAVLGASRNGKSNYAKQPFLHQTVVLGDGGIYLDPGDQEIHSLKRFLGADGVRERVVEISRASLEGADGEELERSTPSFNPFDLFGRTETAIPRRLSAFANMFTAVQGWNPQTNTRAINLTRQAVETLMYLALKLPANCQPTMFQIGTLLERDKWREAICTSGAIPRHLRSYWEDTYPKISKDAGPPVTHLIQVMRSDAALRGLFGASESTFDLRKAMDERKIVLVCLGEPGIEHKFLANVLLFDLVRAFFSRGQQNEPRFMAVLDELHTYDGSVSGSVADLLEQAAKFGGRIFALTQNFLRLRRETQIALLTNKSLLISFMLELEAADRVANGWTRGPEPEVLADLPPYHCIADTVIHRHGRQQFLLKTLPVERVPGIREHLNDAAVPALERRLKRSGRRPSEVSRELETLDERIIAHLLRLTVVDGGKASGPEDPA